MSIANEQVIFNAGVTMSGGAGTLSFDVKPNITYLVGIWTFHATPASLASITFTSANTTPLLLDTVSNSTTNGKRLSVYRIRSSTAHAAETFTITALNSINQSTDVYVAAWGSLEAILASTRNVKQGNITSGTTLTITYDNVFSSPHNGGAFFTLSSVSGTALTPRSGWTERLDAAGVGTLRKGYQLIAVNDTAASVVAGSGITLGIALELVAVTDPAVVSVPEAYQEHVSLNVAFPFTLNLRAGRLTLLAVDLDRTAVQTPTWSVSAPGVTWTQLADTGNTGNVAKGRVYWTVPTVDLASHPHTISSSDNISNDWGVRKYEVANFDDTLGADLNGIMQVKVATPGSSVQPPGITFDNAPHSLNSAVMQIWFQSSNNAMNPSPGYQELQDDLNTGTHRTQMSWRANWDPTPNSINTGVAAVTWGGIAIEIAGRPANVASNAPVATLILPLEVDPLPTTTAVVIEIDDEDGDLISYVLFATFPTVGVSEVVWNGTSFTAQYASSSSRTTIIDGFRNTSLRNGGWPDSSVVISIIAFDSTGNVTTASYSWLVDMEEPAEPTAIDLAIADSEDRARDIYIDPVTNNFALTSGGDLALVGGIPSIVQDLRQSLRMVKGEWFLDIERGLPWFDSILGVKNPNVAIIREIFRDGILGVVGVLDIISMNVVLDKITRQLSVPFKVSTELGELVETIEVVR